MSELDEIVAKEAIETYLTPDKYRAIFKHFCPDVIFVDIHEPTILSDGCAYTVKSSAKTFKNGPYTKEEITKATAQLFNQTYAGDIVYLLSVECDKIETEFRIKFRYVEDNHHFN